MKNLVTLFKACILCLCYTSYGQGLNDGPYIFIESKGLIQKSIVNGEVISEKLNSTAYNSIYKPEAAVFSSVEKIAVLSDIHGQFDLAIDILKSNNIIDEQLNWSFGAGHFVIVGDVFDRGPKVNEVLWLIYRLEQQAKEKGGYVHFLLGNHEYMVLHKDLRYVNQRYLEAAKLLNLDYDELYSNKTVLGRWLRSKPTIIIINDNVFVHGGLSQDFLSKVNFDIDRINETMRASIDISKTELKSTDFYSTYYGSTGPIWYRGYFNDDINHDDIDEILTEVTSEHIVVGHCSFDEIIRVYDGKIYGVDSSIKNGKNGEVLFIENDTYYRGLKNGTRKEFE